jgi:hypothetical protein
MRRLSLLGLVMCAALITSASPAGAATDPAGDFLSTYTGAHDGDMDILNASVAFDGVNFRLAATLNGPVGETPNSLYTWAINRGGGTDRLAARTPPLGTSILFDAVAVLFPDASALEVVIPPAGPPVGTPLTGAVVIDGDTITGLIPLALLPSNGFDPRDYTFTLFTRQRVTAGVDGFNSEIGDLAAPQHASVPEPATWAMMLIGFGGLGAAVRAARRRNGAASATT